MLGVPTVSDRIAQTVVALVLEPLLEPVFHADSYGYRPGKSAHDPLAVTRKRCWQRDWVLEYDIRGLFDNIDHQLLLKALRHHCGSPEDKFAVVLETASMNKAELAEHCRKKGLFAEQIAVWRENCLQCNATVAEQSKAAKKQERLAQQQVKRLKKELRRKEKALAETAALLALRKKMHAIWGEDEDE